MQIAALLTYIYSDCCQLDGGNAHFLLPSPIPGSELVILRAQKGMFEILTLFAMKNNLGVHLLALAMENQDPPRLCQRRTKVWLDLGKIGV